ncbi:MULTISPECIES: VOC family protein [Pseudomonas aeruginosa group]|uniref:VOC family protein n=1 Tax=Pseudomonas aeruginosa group TaxID=136841 RepID=UPI001F1FF564|nr:MULTISPECIES: VOC family protein [Pseudomonas aeruginosa group]MCP1650905.1 catechol 2,3-dioxygenase-like lactoylglutathione lyase family enzyme [Pseudomonas nitroreducens]MCP1688857.1 catechol 2,3-dioxygenase-like lactoylglutathione lyase family enzyme [Pseudomonas nitroreducens]
MSTASVELKVFVPARDFALSQQFYKDLGFLSPWNSEELAYFHHGDHCAFLLQNYYVKEFAENLMLHLLVEDADAWYARVRDAGLAERYGVRLGTPEDQPWKMRDFTLHDPSGVLWRIGHNLD